VRGVRHALLCFIGLALLMKIRMLAPCPIDCIDSIKVKPSRVLKRSSIYWRSGQKICLWDTLMTRYGFEEVKDSKLANRSKPILFNRKRKASINRRPLPYRQEAVRWVSSRAKPLGYVHTIAVDIACAEKAKR